MGCSPAADQGKNFSGSASDQRDAGSARTVDDPAAANAVRGDSTVIGSFESQAKSVADQIGDLMVSEQALLIDRGLKNGLLVKRRDALDGVYSNNMPEASAKLQDFINLCKVQAAKVKFPAAQANTLLSAAQRTRAVLGC